MEWTHIIVAVVSGVLSAGFVTALATAYVKVAAARHQHRREDRGDEIDVLQQTVKELRRDRDEGKREMRALKDEHTACLIKTERLQSRVAWLEARELERETRETGGAEGGDGDGANPAG